MIQASKPSIRFIVRRITPLGLGKEARVGRKHTRNSMGVRRKEPRLSMGGVGNSQECQGGEEMDFYLTPQGPSIPKNG